MTDKLIGSPSGGTIVDNLRQTTTEDTTTGVAATLVANGAYTRFLTSAGLVSVTAISGGADGIIQVLSNKTGSAITIINDSGIDGFLTGNSEDFTVDNNASLTLQYDGASTKWRVISHTTINSAELTYTPTTPAHWPDPDPTTAKEALDDLAEDLTETDTNVDDLVTLSGVAENSTDLGTFTGATITDNTVVKTALQDIETAHEETDTNTDDLVTLSGVAENSTDLGTFTGSTITDTNDVKGALQELETALEGADSDVDDLITLSGVPAASTDLGTFTGSTITDNVTVKVALQEVETAYEETDVNVDDLVTLSGVAENATDLGTFTGTTIADTRKVKEALQDVETAYEETDTNVDDLVTLSGVAENATDLGTFTGTIITDTNDVKGALQDLETDVDAIQTVTGVAAESVDLGTFTGSTIPDSSTIKGALQSTETAYEETDTNVDDLVTLSGVAENATDLGTFTGVTITDTNDVKGALQDLETALESADSDVDDLITLSGVPAGSTDLGTFTGSTITDNVVVKVALQDVETAYEETDTNVDDLVTLSGVAENATDLGTFSGSTITDTNDVKGALQELETAHESHLNGGTSKHDATEVDYERVDGSKTDIQAASDDVETALTDLDDNKISKAGSIAFTGDQSMGSNKITSLAAGVDPADAVNRAQLDAVTAGTTRKEAVRAATTAALPANTPSGTKVGKTLTATANGALTVDGVAMASADRLLVKDEGSAINNGIYDVTDAGSAGTAWVLTRAIDADGSPANEVTGSMAVFVQGEGTVNDFTGWAIYDVVGNIDVDVAAQNFTQFQGLPQFTASLGVELLVNDFRADLLSGGGIKTVGNELAVEPADIAGTGLKDDGADNLEVDFSTAYNDSKAVSAADLSSNTNGKGASILGLEDSGGLITATDAEGAFAEIAGDIDDLVTLSGVAENSTDLGTFTGTTITDNTVIKTALQDLETAHEETDTNVDDLVTLSGVAENATDLGTFTGSTITDTNDVKGALQELETAVETSSVGSTSLEAQLVSTSNVGLSTEQTIDGVTTSSSTVLLTGQSAPAENGMYTTAPGTWTRIADLNTASEFGQGRLIVVREGTTKGDTLWAIQSTISVVDTDPVDIDQVVDVQVSQTVTLSGVAANATDLGTFTGTTITDTNDIKGALQEVETAYEETDTNVDDLVTLSGVAENATDLGTFTGSTITDTNDVKGALQELETAYEETDTNVDDLITLSGVAENATDLGTFTGTTITDTNDVKGALQELETETETKASSTDLTNHASSTTTHGITSAIVGKDEVQTFTNKTHADLKLSTEGSGEAGPNLTSTSNIPIRILTSASLTEIQTIAGADADGETLILQNDTGGEITLKNEFGGAGQVVTGTSADVAFADGASLQFYSYNPGGGQRWYVTGGTGSGAGGGGTGDASSTATRLWDTFEDSIFQQLTAIDFSQDEATQVDGSSTGAYSSSTNNFEFSGVGETLVTTDSLLSTDEFITPAKVLGKLQLVVFWNEGEIDDAATYEVKTTTGSYETVSMTRVGLASDAFIGTLDISSYTSPDNLTLRITSSAGSKAIVGYGIFYETSNQIQTGEHFYQEEQFDSNSSPDTWTLTWTPDPEILQIRLKETGQSFSPASVADTNGFTVTGSTITFPAGSFTQDVSESFTLVFSQSIGTADSSSSNASKLANHTSQLDAIGVKTASCDHADIGYVSAPFTSITGRAQIRDLSKLAAPKMGIERIKTVFLGETLSGESDSGNIIQGSHDHLDRLRFSGNWFAVQAATIGQYISMTGDSGDYCEITFYGTGLNIMVGLIDGNERGFNAAVDGAGSTLISTLGSNVISLRNYNANVVLPVASGLTAGLHTVKLSGTGNANTRQLMGIEILNETATLEIPAGDILVGDERHTIAAESLAYNSGFDGSSDALGTKGGHVVVYSEKNPSTGVVTTNKRFKAVDVTQLNLAAADHSNEEVTAKYHWRQFGADRVDDFSTVSTGATDRAFTLDDGTTTLVGDDIKTVSSTGGVTVDNGGSLSLIFIGTGLDIVWHQGAAGTFDDHSVTVDGSSVGDLPGTGLTTRSQSSLVSGLAYGTHVVKITRDTAVSADMRVFDFIIYGPAKPAIPAGAAELASYNLMADFVGVSAGGNITAISEGVLSKSSAREITYEGSGWTIDLDVLRTHGHAVKSSTNGDKYGYTFFGTGIEFAEVGVGSTSYTVDLNGSPLGTTGTVTFHGGGSTSYTSGSSTIAGIDFRVSIADLPMGKNTVTFTKTNTTAGWLTAAGIITPIHVPQADRNLLRDDLIGSNSLKSEAALPDFKKGKISFPDGVDLGASSTKWQRKNLSANVAGGTSNAVELADLRFTGLKAGCTYRAKLVLMAAASDGDMWIFTGDGNTVSNRHYMKVANTGGTNEKMMIVEFVSDGNPVTFYWGHASGVNATAVDQNRTPAGFSVVNVPVTYSVLEELPNHKETNEW